MGAVSCRGGGEGTILCSLHVITSTRVAQLLCIRDSAACLCVLGASVPRDTWSTFVEFLLWTLMEAFIVCALRLGFCKTQTEMKGRTVKGPPKEFTLWQKELPAREDILGMG